MPEDGGGFGSRGRGRGGAEHLLPEGGPGHGGRGAGEVVGQVERGGREGRGGAAEGEGERARVQPGVALAEQRAQRGGRGGGGERGGVEGGGGRGGARGGGRGGRGQAAEVGQRGGGVKGVQVGAAQVDEGDCRRRRAAARGRHQVELGQTREGAVVQLQRGGGGEEGEGGRERRGAGAGGLCGHGKGDHAGGGVHGDGRGVQVGGQRGGVGVGRDGGGVVVDLGAVAGEGARKGDAGAGLVGDGDGEQRGRQRVAGQREGERVRPRPPAEGAGQDLERARDGVQQDVRGAHQVDAGGGVHAHPGGALG